MLPHIKADKGSFKFTPAQMGGRIVGVILGALIAACLMIWCNIQRKTRMEKRGLVRVRFLENNPTECLGQDFDVLHWDVL